MKTVYLDYAATTPVIQPAKDAVIKYLNTFYNPSSAYAGAREVREAVEKARADIASCIGALPEEIYFTSGSTEGNNIAIQGGIKAVSGRFITTNIEHPSVMNLVDKYPDNCYVLDVKYDGSIDLRELESALDFNDFVSIMLINNEIGYIQPMHDIAKRVKRHKGIIHTDATQAIGHIPIDVRELDVNILTASGHKFGAPKGVGFIYIRKGTHIPSLTLGGGQENGFRSGTENVGGIVAMAAALTQATKDLKRNTTHIQEISDYCIEKFESCGFSYSFNFTSNNHYAGIVNVCLMGTRGEEVVEFLSQNDVYISSGSACHSHDDKPSHVLLAIGCTTEQAESSIRISIGNDTTKAEIDRLFEVLNLYYTLRGEDNID